MSKNLKNDKFSSVLVKDKERLEEELNKLYDNINYIQSGNDNKTYWNGENAKELIKELIKYLGSCGDLLDDVNETVEMFKK